MNEDRDVEGRIRRYAQAFRREANPRADLANRLVAGVRVGRPQQTRLAFLPAVAMAGGVLVGGLLIAFGAWQLRSLGHPTPPPAISLSTPTPSPTSEPTATPTPGPTASPTSSPTPSGAVPSYVPGLAAIQMVGPHLGWAVGSQGIYATTDGSHWNKQASSGDSFIGVDFISTTTGWAVGSHSLLGTTDGGRSWQQLGEAQQWIRSVHFISGMSGWGIAGGSEPFAFRGVATPGTGGMLVVTSDGGQTWTSLSSPADPQTVCFSDRNHGWLATAQGAVYRSADGGGNWTRVLQMPGYLSGLPSSSRVECAAPSAAWVEFAPGGAAAGSSPYIVYATLNGQSWRAVMEDQMTMNQAAPGVPQGPGSYPGSFSVVDPGDAVFIGDSEAANRANTVIASNGGATLKATGSIPGPGLTYGAAFVSTSSGWLLIETTTNQIAIMATSDGGYHWSTQLSVGS